jgi:hypothetical protein
VAMLAAMAMPLLGCVKHSVCPGLGVDDTLKFSLRTSISAGADIVGP